MSNWNIQALSRTVERTGFNCGVQALNGYLERQISQDVKRKACAAYVATAKASNVVQGYYTLSAASVRLARLPQEVTKKLPRYPDVPAFLIGRLAVSQSNHGKGLGRILVMDALLRCLDLSSDVGAALVLVDAKDQAAAGFYERFQFQPLDANRLFLPLTTVAKLVQ